MKTVFWFLLSFVLVTFSSAYSTAKICKYKGRQMTAGQINIDCFSKATCMSDGNIKKVPSCPRYFCLPKSKVTGYKRFETNQSFPHCCGGEICEEKYKSFW
ncbi:uncharacterized protein LOC122499296 isoform X2 [Leptopilina heterotoma]|uniref:uncharacterized protein LOC122499296 isoform X2 n=1 Tax=Leptopilina heterotoma TaxID=63436 RepID=UPI001CA98DFF|nr:uncharacterized protein LOC122499296 isoform X2 [Leptopilina heterotoma]